MSGTTIQESRSLDRVTQINHSNGSYKYNIHSYIYLCTFPFYISIYVKYIRFSTIYFPQGKWELWEYIHIRTDILRNKNRKEERTTGNWTGCWLNFEARNIGERSRKLIWFLHSHVQWYYFHSITRLFSELDYHS